MTTSEKSMLAEVAQRAVASPQRGFVSGPNISDDAFGMDGTMTAFRAWDTGGNA